MAQLNVVVRTLIRLAFGTALPPGSHQDALQSYRKATQLCPERLIHRQAYPHYPQQEAVALIQHPIPPFSGFCSLTLL